MLLIQFPDVDWSNELARTEVMLTRIKLCIALCACCDDLVKDIPKYRHQKRVFNRRLIRLRKNAKY